MWFKPLGPVTVENVDRNGRGFRLYGFGGCKNGINCITGVIEFVKVAVIQILHYRTKFYNIQGSECRV
jgi:hypothetical protein